MRSTNPKLSSLLPFVRYLGACLVMTGFATLAASAATAGEMASKANPDDSKQVARGKAVYKRFCSLCHGADLKGQADWKKRKADGKLPAPPHDETGHTWHHPDDLLFGITKYGLVPPYGPEDYASDMPALGGTLSDADIWAVLAYIKSRWPPATRKLQAEITRESQQ